MVRVTVVVRELGRLKPDYSVDFDLPEVPDVGSYISIKRPTKDELYGEDLVVRKVWWSLAYPETSSFGSSLPKVGSMTDVVVECDPAVGPHSSDRWLKVIEGAKSRGVEVEEFQVARFSVREADFKKT